MVVARPHSYARDKAALVRRMKRIEGQARGIRQMIEADRYCIDIVQQLSALASAAEEVSLIILEDHIEGCVSEAVRSGKGEGYIRELMTALRRAIRR